MVTEHKEKTKASLKKEEIDDAVKSCCIDLISHIKHNNQYNVIDDGAIHHRFLDQIMKEKLQKLDLQVKEEVIAATGEAAINRIQVCVGKFIGSGG